MCKDLVIVESPAKAKTIQRFLGEKYIVKSSYGHIRDLSEKDLSIDINNGFAPIYVIPPDKKAVVKELKSYSSKSDTVLLATDEDREGEAISWHLKEVLELDDNKTKRIVFHEITKETIIKAIKEWRTINMNLVKAQQARRVLDRLVGFELSPLLWKKIKPALSAGRVQSVAVRLIVEREKEINSFKETKYYRVTAKFSGEEKNKIFDAELSVKINTKEEVIDFLNKCINAQYHVANIEIKPAKQSPPPPFTTSTLQQEASRKLGFSVAKTMMVAQQLYEAGYITYMRTDSVNLSDMIIAAAKKEITKLFGQQYSKPRKYKTKTLNAQEAHEAIRPTYINNRDIDGDISQKKLYDLIWKRTIASQMEDASLEKTNITISISNSNEHFIAKGEVIKFDGFLKLYKESSEDDNSNSSSENILPKLKLNEKLINHSITCSEEFTHHPPRYS